MFELVCASTLYKMLYLDGAFDLFGLTGDDRKTWEVIDNKKVMMQLKKKFGFSLTFEELITKDDYPTPLAGGGSTSPPNIYVRVPDQWYELLHFKNWGKLPVVKYRSGTIYVNMKTMDVTFDKGMKILVNGKEYSYDGIKLVSN